jgi:hypothetical protein
MYLYVLVAIALTDNPGTQTIGYYSTIEECHNERNNIEKKTDKNYVKLDCIPLRIN